MATQAHTEVPGGHKTPFPPFNPETFASQLLWFAVFFVLLYFMMSRVALPRVGGILAARRERIEGDLKAMPDAGSGGRVDECGQRLVPLQALILG